MMQLFEIAATDLMTTGSNSCHKPKITIIAPTKTIGSICTPSLFVPKSMCRCLQAPVDADDLADNA